MKVPALAGKPQAARPFDFDDLHLLSSLVTKHDAPNVQSRSDAKRTRSEHFDVLDGAYHAGPVRDVGHYREGVRRTRGAVPRYTDLHGPLLDPFEGALPRRRAHR